MASIHRNPHGPRGEHTTPVQEERVYDFLYEEGGQECSTVADFLGVKEDRARVVLTGLLDQGRVQKTVKHNKSQRQVFWYVP
jgi:hypothetical protein